MLEENTKNLIWPIILLVFLTVVIANWIVQYFTVHAKDIRYLKNEVRRAHNKNEYIYWKTELTALRISIFTGLSFQFSKKIVKLTRKSKHVKKSVANENIMSLILPSILGMVICAICLTGTTFSWFNSSTATPVQTVKTANYGVISSVTSEDVVLEKQDGVYNLSAGKTYSITVTATGNAKNGYCAFKFTDKDGKTKELHTVPIESGKTAVFKIKCAETGYKFETISQFGISSQTPTDLNTPDKRLYPYEDEQENIYSIK